MKQHFKFNVNVLAARSTFVVVNENVAVVNRETIVDDQDRELGAMEKFDGYYGEGDKFKSAFGDNLEEVWDNFAKIQKDRYGMTDDQIKKMKEVAGETRNQMVMVW